MPPFAIHVDDRLDPDARLVSCLCPACREAVRVEDMAAHDCGWCPWRDDPEAYVREAYRIVGLEYPKPPGVL